jgi:hypothetical protein
VPITFEQLYDACRICHNTHPYLARIEDWSTKREYVALYLQEIPNLVTEYAKRVTQPHPKNPRATIFDALPGLRLATTCEALANCVYAMSDIAATIANQASHGVVPSSFNAVRKKAVKGELDAALLNGLPDLDWYARVRELRTEWSHHSSIFVAGGDDDPIICVRSFRRKQDQVMWSGNVEVRPREIMNWSERATIALDAFGSAVFFRFIAPTFPLAETLFMPFYDELGFPVQDDKGLVQGEKITIREYLSRAGIEL